MRVRPLVVVTGCGLETRRVMTATLSVAMAAAVAVCRSSGGFATTLFVGHPIVLKYVEMAILPEVKGVMTATRPLAMGAPTRVS